MSTLTFMLAWCVLQVTLLSLLTAGIYLLVGRRGPAVSSAVLLAGAAGVLLTTALAVSPWPRWYTVDWPAQPVEAGADRQIEPAQSDTAVAAAHETAATAGRATARQVELADTSLWTALADTLRTGFRPAPLDAPRATPWPAIVLGLGALLCVGRLFVGLWAVRRYRRQSQPIVDAELFDELVVLQAEMSCPRQIEPRESALVSSPAVVGWRKPLLLLPLDWRTWSDGERRAVLAHELAHVCRGDYPAWLFSQLGLALHFYHPLVHWLVRRLRLEQELAADEWGARVAGSRTAYLRALAQLALRRDAQPVVWAARPFFPRRDTFLRRIEMLRHQQNQPWRATPWRTRLAAVTAVVFAALLVAGLRGPESNTALAQAGAGGGAAAQGSAEKFSLKFVPAEALAVLSVRPAELLAEPGIGEFVKKFDWMKTVEEQTGVPLADLQEVTLVIWPTGSNLAQGPNQTVILRSNKAVDWRRAIDKMPGGAAREAEFGGTKYLRKDSQPAYFIPDEGTLVVANESELRIAITMAQGGFDGLPGPAWTEEWKAQPAGQARFAVNLEGIKAATGFDPARLMEQHRAPGDKASLVAAVGPLVTNTQSLVGSGHVNGGMQLSAVATTGSSDAAVNVAETANALKTLAKNLTSQGRQAMLKDPNTPAGIPALLALLEDLLGKTEIKADDKLVRISATSRYNGAMAAAIFMPAVAQARESARRVQSQNNMKQLGLAMHIFADTHQKLPSAVMLGPDGKTPHSWRVAILPYIEQDALYRQYKFDEPWDSEANRRVLAQMPVLFQSPGDGPRSTNTSYFVLTGNGPMFGDSKAPKFSDITDGTSNTIMIVEAKRDIPWTKPEDIEYDPKQPLPKFGGFFPGGFNAGFGDGSVRFIQDKVDEPTLRALITRAGGEVIGDLSTPPPTQRR